MTVSKPVIIKDSFNDNRKSPTFDNNSVSAKGQVSVLGMLKSILNGQKPVLTKDVEWVAEIFKNMEEANTIPENWDQFILKPGQDPNHGMGRGDIRMSALCYTTHKNGIFWKEKLGESGINNCIVLGCDPAFRFQKVEVDPSHFADSFVLPEGDFNSFHDFLSVIHYNREHPLEQKPIVVDNRNGFWDALKEKVDTLGFWQASKVFFASSEAEAVEFIKSNVIEDNLGILPATLSHPFVFEGENPVLIQGTGNPKKNADFNAVMKRNAPLLKTYTFQSLLGAFQEPDETSLTCLGNAFEKMEAMFHEVYQPDGTPKEVLNGLFERFANRPVVFLANDTGARVKLVDEDGNAIPVDWVNRPELAKAKHLIAEGKEQWWPGPEVKMVSSAMGKSEVFYSTTLKELCANISAEVGKELRIEYVDDSLYLFARLDPENREKVSFFATKGAHVDWLAHEASPNVGEIDFENFSVPRRDNEDRSTRADLGKERLLKDSSTLQGLSMFLDLAKFSHPITLTQEFDGKAANIIPIRKIYRQPIGTIGDFDQSTRSSGFSDFKRIAGQNGFSRVGGTYDLFEPENFEKFLGQCSGLVLGGNEDISLPPIHRAAFYARIMVAIQTNHPAISGKPVVVVRDSDGRVADPVLEWALGTQEFLYNHKLFGAKTEQCLKFAPSLKSAVSLIDYKLGSYVEPINVTYQYKQDGNDEFDRPSISILGSASTFDPQHIDQGTIFATGCAERDLHLRHGACAKGVIGHAGDAFMAYRNEHGKGRMTGIQCHPIMKLEGANPGNDCLKIYEGVGGRKVDIYQSDIQVFLGGGWGTYEEFFDLLVMMDAGRAKPHQVVVVDYAFDSAPKETTYMPLHSLLTPEDIKKYNIKFVPTVSQALDLVDEALPVLRRKYDQKAGNDVWTSPDRGLHIA
ncbi:MAG: LOG family protein [Alphaproteobacteria bacterium]|nr:LOG family protein [Alphaproteobacteria bacterium]